MRLLLHGRLIHGIQNLPGMVVGAGFADVRTGTTRFEFLGFVSGRVPA
jgi:hypothetical protein